MDRRADQARARWRPGLPSPQGKQDEALKQMRESADLQDKVGQGEVDIPAREMLADMQLESGPSAAGVDRVRGRAQAQPEPAEWPLQCRPGGRGCRRQCEGEVLLCRTAEIHRQRRELYPLRARSCRKLRVLHTAGGPLASLPSDTGGLPIFRLPVCIQQRPGDS